MAQELILITGGAGFIGSHSALSLLDRGYRVRVLDSLRPPVHESGLPPPWLPSDVEIMIGDVRDKAAFSKALSGVSRVLHLAAYQDYLPDFSTFFSINTGGTAMLFEVIVEAGLDISKVVVASSQAAYGEGLYDCGLHGQIRPDLRPDAQLQRGEWHVRCPHCGGPATSLPTDETAVNPQNQYALSKYTQELVALNLGRRYSIPTTCLRYSIAQGRWQSPRNAYSGVCRIFTLRALAGKPPLVFEDGAQLRDYVYVGDVAAANVLALEEPATDFAALNVGGMQSLTTLQYAELVVGAIDPSLRPDVPGYYRFGDTRHIVSDSSKLRRLGWQPTLGVSEIVAQYAEWVSSAGFRDESTDAGLERMLELKTLRKSHPEPTAVQPAQSSG
jgi:dTDP-L-rhamnose 4-epimerase